MVEFKKKKFSLKRHRLFPVLKFMFEKCERATENPDILLTTRAAHLDHSSNRSSCRQLDKVTMRQQNEKQSVDQELKYFLKENEHILFDKGIVKATKAQNEQKSEINSSLDEIVSLIFFNFRWLII